MRLLKTLVFASVAFVMCCVLGMSVSEAQSQSSLRSLTYQGLLTDKSGRPVDDGVYSITIRLYSDTSGSSPIWTSTVQSSVQQGVVSLTLGDESNPLPPSGTLQQAGWVSIQLNGQAEMQPFTQLTSTPKALTVAEGGVTSEAIADGAVTKSKMGTDYISSLTVDGNKISGRGANLNLVAGDGLKLIYDAPTKSIILSAGSVGVGGSSKGLTPMHTDDFEVVNNYFLVHGKTTLGDASSDSIDFIGHANTDLDMSQHDLVNVDTIKIGKASTYTGAMSLYSASKSKRITLVADSTSTDRNYKILNVGSDANFLMSQGTQTAGAKLTLEDSLTLGKASTKTGVINMIGQGSTKKYTLTADATLADRVYHIPNVGSDASFLMSTGNQIASTRLSLTDSLTLGKCLTSNGYLQFLNQNSSKNVLIYADSMTSNRRYRIPDVGTNANFLMDQGDQQMHGDLAVTVITPPADNVGNLGSADQRFGDLFLGPHSLHLTSTPDEGVTSDWTADIITSSGDSLGNYRLSDGSTTVMTASTNGDVNVMGGLVTGDGVITGSDIVPDPTQDNTLSLGTPDTRFADVYLGPHSLHLTSTPDEGVTADWTQEVLTDGDSVGSYSLTNGTDIVMTASQTGDVTITGGVVAGDGVITGSDIVPSDGGISLGTPDQVFADLFLGPHSLHLTSTPDEGVTADWTSEIITSGDSLGDYSLTEGTNSVMTASNTGDVTITGGVVAGDGLVAGNDIVPDPTMDNSLSLGTPDTRFADVYLGPHSLHLTSTPDEGVTADWTQEVLTSGDSIGSYSLTSGDDIIMTASKDGNVTITGGVVAGDGVVTTGDIVPDETVDNTVSLGSPDASFSDLYLGPHSLHITAKAGQMPNGQIQDWVLDVSTTNDASLGNLQIFDNSALKMSVTPAGILKLTGGIDMANTRVRNLLSPSASGDATNKGYVDAALNTVSANLSAEALARIAADNTLTTNLAAEVTNRTNAVTTEASARIAADNTLTSNLNAEITRATAAENTLTANLAAEVSNRTNAVTSEANTRSAADVAEASARSAADASEATTRADRDTGLQSAIDAEAATRATADATETAARTAADASEATARTNGDTALQSAINQEAADRASALTAEATARSAGDAAEVTARTNGDTALQSAINQEAADRASAVTAEATARSAGGAAEATARTNGDTALQLAIDQEATTRGTADNTLTTDLATEVTRATNAENALSTSVGGKANDNTVLHNSGNQALNNGSLSVSQNPSSDGTFAGVTSTLSAGTPNVINLTGFKTTVSGSDDNNIGIQTNASGLGGGQSIGGDFAASNSQGQGTVIGGRFSASGGANNIGIQVTSGGASITGASAIAGSLTVTGVGAFGDNVSIPFNKFMSGGTGDNFTYDGKTLGHYSIGFFNDSWNSSGTTWISGYAGIKFFGAGQLAGYITANTLRAEHDLSVGGKVNLSYADISSGTNVSNAAVSMYNVGSNGSGTPAAVTLSSSGTNGQVVMIGTSDPDGVQITVGADTYTVNTKTVMRFVWLGGSGGSWKAEF